MPELLLRRAGLPQPERRRLPRMDGVGGRSLLAHLRALPRPHQQRRLVDGSASYEAVRGGQVLTQWRNRQEAGSVECLNPVDDPHFRFIFI